jgi:predicted O-linked N-acetylglucosamine transferase (SPINDLY family)
MNSDYLCSLAERSKFDLEAVCVISSRTLGLLAQFKSVVLQRKSIGSSIKKLCDLSEVISHIDQASILVNAECVNDAELLLIGVTLSSLYPAYSIKKLAELYEKQSDYARTIRIAEYFQDQHIYDPENLYQLAFALYKSERMDEALEVILPMFASDSAPRVSRLCALILKGLGQFEDAIDFLEALINEDPFDVHSIRALSEIYADLGLYQKSLDILKSIPSDMLQVEDRLGESVLYRFMGELDLAIASNQAILEEQPEFANAMWTQCFNYSIASVEYAGQLLELSSRFWKYSRPPLTFNLPAHCNVIRPIDSKTRIAFLSSDIGEHVVSRFIAPLLRHYDKSKYHISIYSTARRFEQKAVELVEGVDTVISLQGLSAADTYASICNMSLDVIVETNGFTRNSGLGILANRCAPVQCHYIGYHATTGLDTIDYFLGDSITTPLRFQEQYSEKLVPISSLWMAYDQQIEFPVAFSTAQRECLVMGAFSQITKINRLTLGYWAAAMEKTRNSILVIKDRGAQCFASRKRIEDALSESGVDTSRVYFFGPVGSHFDHLDSYNAIDIALDTTPWSGATTAFEALGMGVPLVAICGDTTSARMSTSVVSASGMPHLIAHSKEEFAEIVADLAENHMQIRDDKGDMQQKIRSGILFDEKRICRDFYATVDRLVQEKRQSQ